MTRPPATPLPAWQHRAPRIICLGLSALDYIWTVDALPGAEASKTAAGNFATKGGGMAATAAVTVARLGGEARFWGRAGADAEGRWMRAALAAEGVNVEAMRLFEGARSSISGVFVDRLGERRIANFRGADLPVAADWLPLEAIRGADAVLSDPRWPEGTQALFAAARAAAVPTVLDADMADDAIFESLLPLTDHAIFSEGALAAFAGAEGLARAASFGCAVTAVTRGARGVEWLRDGKRDTVPAYPVEVVDTTGAGDVFHGAYAYALGAGGTVEEIMTFASAVAALKCTRPDGRSGIPTLDETLDLWRRHL